MRGIPITWRRDISDYPHHDLFYLSNMVHGCDRQPASMLPLRQVEQGDHRGSLVPVGVDRHDGISSSLVLCCELKRSLGIVGSSVP